MVNSPLPEPMLFEEERSLLNRYSLGLNIAANQANGHNRNLIKPDSYSYMVLSCTIDCSFTPIVADLFSKTSNVKIQMRKTTVNLRQNGEERKAHKKKTKVVITATQAAAKDVHFKLVTQSAQLECFQKTTSA